MSNPTPQAQKNNEKAARPFLQVGFVEVRCGACNAMIANVSPGAVISTVCRRCNAQVVFCAPTVKFVVDNNVPVSKD